MESEENHLPFSPAYYVDGKNNSQAMMIRQTSLMESIEKKQRQSLEIKLKSFQKRPHSFASSSSHAITDMPIIIKAPVSGCTLPRGPAASKHNSFYRSVNPSFCLDSSSAQDSISSKGILFVRPTSLQPTTTGDCDGDLFSPSYSCLSSSLQEIMDDKKKNGDDKEMFENYFDGKPEKDL